MFLNSILILSLLWIHPLSCDVLQKAGYDQFPSMVAILDLKMDFVASATLISTNHVLSAARWHVPEKALMALAGDISLSRTNRKSRQIRSIIKIIVHPNYDENKDPSFDIAICLVSKPFKLSRFVQPNPICGYPPEVGEYCFAVGWGLNYEGANKRPNSFPASNVRDTSKVRTSFIRSEPNHSNELLCQEFEIFPRKICRSPTRPHSICGSLHENKSVALENGGPILCSYKLCGLFLNHPRINNSIVSINVMKPLVTWLDRQISQKAIEVSHQYYFKRSSAKKNDFAGFLIGCVGMLKVLMHFI